MNFTDTKELNRRQARWSELLSDFNFKLVHRSGSLNAQADILSRVDAEKHSNHCRMTTKPLLDRAVFHPSKMLNNQNVEESENEGESSEPSSSNNQGVQIASTVFPTDDGNDKLRVSDRKVLEDSVIERLKELKGAEKQSDIDDATST